MSKEIDILVAEIPYVFSIHNHIRHSDPISTHMLVQENVNMQNPTAWQPTQTAASLGRISLSWKAQGWWF